MKRWKAGVGNGSQLARGAAALVLVLTLAACATVHHPAPGDPFEGSNRAIFAFNEKFNARVTLPIAWIYMNWIPGFVRNGVRNVLANAQLPAVFANDLLQGNVAGAGETFGRFVLNSTIGMAGLTDVASKAGLPAHQSDFGQTLARYGVPAGPFLVLPLIGPSTPRDTIGAAADMAADPLFYVPPGWPLLAHAGLVAGTHTLAPFEKNAGTVFLRQQLGQGSVDPYATMRSAYFQQRKAEISAGGGLPAE